MIYAPKMSQLYSGDHNWMWKRKKTGFGTKTRTLKSINKKSR